MLHRLGVFAPWERGHDFTPPEPAPGEVTGPPDFVGIGVQKAGTSWWYDLIADHPDASTLRGFLKELHYFSHFCAVPFGDAEVARYCGWFPRQPGRVVGEWTPDYLAYPWVPPLLARTAPATKVLVLVRDPVERFRSGLSYRLNQGATDSEAAVSDAVRQGFYARCLRRYFDYFETEQIKVLQYEKCVHDPAGQLAETYRFLGMHEHHPAELRRSINVSSGKLPIDPDARSRLVELYRSDVEELSVMIPSLDLSLWPNFAAAAA